MTNIFVSSAKEDAECSEHILQGLEAKGYSAWREPPSLSLEAFLPSQTSRTKEENAILGSAAVILIWSGHAAQAEQVKQQLSFAQQLKKQVLSVVIDTTSLPPTLVISTLSILSQPPCVDAIAQLLLHLPAADSTDPLITISRDMTDERILTRKEAIETAATLLQQDTYRERVLALLEYVASNDTMTGVRDKAQEVLDAEKNRKAPPQRSNQSSDMQPVTCPTGHTTYVNARRLCSQESTFVYRMQQRGGKAVREFLLKCEQCGEEMSVYIDCEGYQ